MSHSTYVNKLVKPVVGLLAAFVLVIGMVAVAPGIVPQAAADPGGDCGSTTATACTWSDLSVPVDGVVDSRLDQDWYRITPGISGQYVFTVSGSPTRWGRYAAAYLLNSDGWSLARVTGSLSAANPTFQLVVNLVGGTTYYIAMADLVWTEPGAYTITTTAMPHEDAQLTASQQAATISGSGDTFWVFVTSNVDWQVMTSDWVSASPSSGHGNAWVAVKVEANPNKWQRTLSATIYGSGVSRKVSITQPPDDCGATTASACAWNDLSKPVNGTLEMGGDKDWYKITPAVAGQWTFAASVPPTGGTNDSVGTLYRADGTTVVAYNDDANPPAERQFAFSAYLDAGATYYLEVRDCFWNSTGGYTVTATMPPGPQLAVTPLTWQAPSQGIAKTVQITSNVSWQVAVPAGVRASSTRGTGSGSITLNVEPNTSDRPRNLNVVFTAGDLIQVMVIGQPPDQSVGCGLTSGWACTWSNLAAPVDGKIVTAGNSSWLKFTANASGSWTFTGSAPASGGVGSTYARLRGENGNELASNNGAYASNGQFSITFQLEYGYTYYLEIKGSNPSSTGAYTVTAAPPQGNSGDCGPSPDAACIWWGLSRSLNSTIDTPGDVDWFTFTPTTTQTWSFTGTGTGTRALPIAMGDLYVDNGGPFLTKIAQGQGSDSNPNFSFGAQLEAGKTYYLEVQSGRSGQTGDYRVTATN